MFSKCDIEVHLFPFCYAKSKDHIKRRGLAYQCGLPITFANSLGPDQARQNSGPDLDPNCMTLMVFLKEYF